MNLLEKKISTYDVHFLKELVLELVAKEIDDATNYVMELLLNELWKKWIWSEKDYVDFVDSLD